MEKNKMYILYPPISEKERYFSEIGSAGGKQIPLGIYYVASYLRANNFEVKVTDAEALKLSTWEIIEQVKSFNPKFVGIGSTTVAFHRALEVAREIKKQLKDIIVILGGPHVTSNSSHAMSFNEFDFGVLHEGEQTIVELLNAINNHSNYNSVNGIIYRANDKLVRTAPRDYIEDLDLLPFPAYDLIEDINLYAPPPSNYKTLPVINMITTRGCPSLCTFCDNNIFGRKYRKRSAENIVEEIKLLRKNYQVREIAFVDDTLLIDKKRIYKLFELLEQEKIEIDWTCMSRINNVDYDFLSFVKAKGGWHISFGIESGDEGILKTIKKNISIEKAREVIEDCHKLGIRTKGFFIIGHPTESLETLNKTIKFACELKLDDIVATINTPIPGSLQYAEAEKYGTFDQTNWAEFTYWRPVFIPFGLTKEILLNKHKEIYRKFYLRPRVLIRYLLSFFAKGGLKRFWTILKASMFLFKKKVVIS